jgi:hypothetical protein
VAATPPSGREHIKNFGKTCLAAVKKPGSAPDGRDLEAPLAIESMIFVCQGSEHGCSLTKGTAAIGQTRMGDFSK